jgi:hypothetical protein
MGAEQWAIFGLFPRFVIVDIPLRGMKCVSAERDAYGGPAGRTILKL